MKVLIYTHAFAPNIGGVETIVMSLARGLAGCREAEGTPSAEVTVATATPRGAFDDASLPFPVLRRPARRALLPVIRAADVVHLAGPVFFPLLAAMLLRKRVVVEHHGFQAICPNGQFLYEPTQKPCPGHFMAGRHRECLRCNAQSGWLRSFLMWFLTFPRRWLCTHVQSNITPTEWLSTLLHLPRMVTIHHGLPTEGQGEFSAALSSPPAVAFMGRLVGTKGVDTLLRAASRVKAKGREFSLRIIGDGPERARLEAQTQAFNLADRVKFLGYQPDAKLGEALAGVEVMVMPSLAGEVFGLVAAENMMRGILPIVPEGGALAEVVGDAGLRFPPGDDEALARCLEQAIDLPDNARNERRRARERALALFSEGRMVDAHLALYQGLTANGSGCHAVAPPSRIPQGGRSQLR
jgi:glycosyltransferase involved in cell wall biosynthesis